VEMMKKGVWMVALGFLTIEETIAHHVLAKICEHC
jgi:hypothetical protein